MIADVEGEPEQVEFAALVRIVEMQAQALNDVITSANDLQRRVAQLEAQAAAASKESANGDKRKVILLQ